MPGCAAGVLVAVVLLQAEGGVSPEPLSAAPLVSQNPAPDAPGQPAASPLAAPAVSDTSFGVHVGVNLGLLAVDVQVRHFYLYAAGNLGIPLVTNGTVGATVLGVGYTRALSTPAESMWFMDFFVHALPGWRQVEMAGSCAHKISDYCTTFSNQPFVGLGVGVGFRFLHRSGLTIGFKLPVFGAAVGRGVASAAYDGPTGAERVTVYFEANLIALPIVSVGFRF